MKRQSSFFIGSLALVCASLASASSEKDWQNYLSCSNGELLLQKVMGHGEEARFVIRNRYQGDRIFSTLKDNPRVDPASLRYEDGGSTLVIDGLLLSEIINPRNEVPIFLAKDVLGQQTLLWRSARGGSRLGAWRFDCVK